MFLLNTAPFFLCYPMRKADQKTEVLLEFGMAVEVLASSIKVQVQ